ncbi:MAG: TonB-dependent receptor, partial [bacterium]
IFGFFLNDQLAGQPRLTLDNPDAGTFAFYDVGGAVGGPIKKDKLWYFLSYNPTVQKEQVYLPGLGLHDYESTSHRFASKLTWRVDDKNDVELSVFGDPATGEGIAGRYSWLDPPASMENTDPMLKDTKSGGVNGAVNGRHWLSERFVLQSTASVVTRKDEFVPSTARGLEEPLFVDTETGLWSGGSPFDSETDNTTFSAGLKGTWILGNHTVKGGAHYTHLDTDFKVRNDVIWRYSDVEYYHFMNMEDGTVSSQEPSAFLQDSWRLRDRLRLNFGVRWDGQYIINSEGDVGQRFLDQWQPRLGFTYQLGERGAHQIFGSFGRFYQNVSMAAPALYMISNGYYRLAYYDHDPRVDPTVTEWLVYEDLQAIEESKGLEGQHYDEFTLGYEQQITQNSKATVRGIYRTLRNGLEDIMSDETGEWFWGNPGSGDLSEFPNMKREYTALELTFQRTGADRLNFLASYILSRNTGNHPGVFPSDYGDGWANASQQYDLREQLDSADGLLPNDRPHVFKFNGSYRLGYGVTAGAIFFWMSGTPLSEYGGAMFDPTYNVFITPRGEAGRTPSIWDLGLRVTYDLASLWKSSVHPRVIADFLHVASRREGVNFVQREYLARDEDGPTDCLSAAGRSPFRYGGRFLAADSSGPPPSSQPLSLRRLETANAAPA